MSNSRQLRGDTNNAEITNSIIKAINETFLSHNKEADLAEIKTDIKYLTGFVEKSDKRNDDRFEKIETGLNQVLSISQDQETRIVVIEKANKEYHERIKGRVVIAATLIAAIATIFWDILKGIWKP